MTKAEIVDQIAEQTGITKKDVLAVVEVFMNVVKTNMVEKRENVYLRGFGTFQVKRRAKKTARNISKNTTLIIDEHDFPAFKPAKTFISKMRGN